MIKNEKIKSNNNIQRLAARLHSRIAAFTLAEVLITLGIIGVVAAMTIPTLISSYNKRVVETRLQKVYSVMNNAIKLSTIENGETVTWDTLSNDSTYDDVYAWYNKYLANYLKVSKVEQQPNSEHLLIYFLDGSILRIENMLYDMDFYPQQTGLTDRRPGVNHFAFRFQPKYLNETQKTSPSLQHIVNPGFNTYSYAWDGTIEGAKHSTINNRFGCYEETGMLCAKLIQLNGWKIPDDYPYKF